MQRVRLLSIVVGLGLGTAPLPALAIDNLGKGMSTQQLFNTNCAVCHRSPRGLGAAMGSWSLSGFLTEHYTTSKSAAGALAGYLQTVNKNVPEAPQRRRRARPSSR